MARILTLTNWYPPHHFGGYEVLCDDVMTRLQARGHEVEVICSDETVPGPAATSERPFPVHRRLRMYWRDGGPWTPTFAQQLDIERANQREMLEVLARFKPDVVSVWHMGALSLNLLTTVARSGIPMVYAICDEWLIYGLDLDPWSRRWYRNPFRRLAGKGMARALGIPTVLSDLGPTGCFCFLSEFTKESSRQASPWTSPVAPVVYPGIDQNRFPLKLADPSKPWSGRLLYMGRLDARKGTDTLIRAMAHLPDASLSLLGRGEASERVRLEALAADLGVLDRLRFQTVASSEIVEAYRSHDCLIFPSEWPEPFGLVPLEAMACHTPVIATGVGGSAEYLVDESNCLLFAPADAQSLARVVTRLAADTKLRESLRTHGATTASQFDLNWTTTAYERCYVAAAEHRLSELSLPPHPSAHPKKQSPSVGAMSLRSRLFNRWRGWHRPPHGR